MVVLGRPIKANILGPPWAHNPMADFPLDPTTVFLFSMGKKRIAVAFLKHVRGLKKKKNHSPWQILPQRYSSLPVKPGY